jgi:hypothetical protein
MDEFWAGLYGAWFASAFVIPLLFLMPLNWTHRWPTKIRSPSSKLENVHVKLYAHVFSLRFEG